MQFDISSISVSYNKHTHTQTYFLFFFYRVNKWFTLIFIKILFKYCKITILFPCTCIFLRKLKGSVVRLFYQVDRNFFDDHLFMGFPESHFISISSDSKNTSACVFTQTNLIILIIKKNKYNTNGSRKLHWM